LSAVAIEYSLAAFAAAPSVDSVIVVVPHSLPGSILDVLFSYRKVAAVVPGGKTRQKSVLAGLKAVKEKPDVIVVHDAARPLVDVETIERLISAAKEKGAVVPAIVVPDSVKFSKNGETVEKSVQRNNYFRAQTPQAFRSDMLIESIRRAEEKGLECTDEAQMVELSGYAVSLIQGNERNVKITSHGDMTVAKSLLGAYTGDFRVGLGYDAHRLVKGRELHLGGIKIEWEYGLLGHSDGDCALHAIADALLGASGLGDIGYFFPPDDESIRGISSTDILAEVGKMAKQNGVTIVNIDCVIICQHPRIADYADKMVDSISRVLGIDGSAVSVKGKTTEGMGFEGTGEGISSIAVALVEKDREETEYGTRSF
jgi:2-C-methyl-D-erythritol 2,4-cyclodiphosphate synthase/2-C-methyl-D-erythritol 4-phosphate cytidylyltransferase